MKHARVTRDRYVESDTALVSRILGREVGGKQNILVLNDEAHHAYRIRKDEPDEEEEDLLGEEDEAEEFYKEATVWIDGLDRIQKLRGINFCVDLSATPYFLGRVGQETNRPFPWVVSDFALTDAIESGLVKIPQLAVRDTTGAEIPGYFNIWRWILPQLTPAERGGKKSSPKPEAVLKWANTPITMLGGLWEELRAVWEQSTGRSAAARLHPRLQEHRDRQGGLRVARARTSRRWASRRRRSLASATPTVASTRFAWTPSRARDRHRTREDRRGRSGCGSRSTRLAEPTGHAISRGGRSIRRDSRSWRRSAGGRSIRRDATSAASSAWGCSPKAGTATPSRTSSGCGRSCRSCSASRWSAAGCGGGRTSSATTA